MTKYTLKIDGMMCGMCEAHINDVIRREVAKAKKVSSSAGKGVSTFVTDGVVDEERLKKAIADTGYTLVSMESEPYVKRGLFG
ncbi:MAG: heavy metal-associated domain-containing protein [Eubacteriales bacterium]|nr:heavy metal-associated domain-containing protein [Eubacteriales bacterium]